MKRYSTTFFLVALFVSVLLVSVAFRQSDSRTRIGAVAPPLSVTDRPTDALKALRGKYVLLCFWSSTDAASREAVARYTAWVERQPNQGVGLLAVNFDKSEPLFNEIVKRDGLNQQLQFRLAGRQAEQVMTDYGMVPGDYGTLLVGPDGRIIAHNPPVDTITGLTSTPTVNKF